MPNWCNNVLSIYFPGDGDVPGERLRELREFVATDDEPLSFRRILPVPVEVDNDPDGMVGYNWRVDNWGTKWEAHEVEARPGMCEIEFFFDTAWAPPVPVVQELSRLFPDAVVGLAYDEPGMDFGGYVMFREGEVVEGAEGGSRAYSWADQMEMMGEWS